MMYRVLLYVCHKLEAAMRKPPLGHLYLRMFLNGCFHTFSTILPRLSTDGFCILTVREMDATYELHS